MTEPKEVAGSAEEVLPGLYHWRISNSTIGGGVSSSHAIIAVDECIFIDPVRLAPEALAELKAPTAILLTARCHQRSAWHYRHEFQTEVWLPHDATVADEEPDRRYVDGDELPCGLIAVRTPGPELPHYSFLWEHDPGVVFCSDLLVHDGAGTLHFVPAQFHEDPEETRRSVHKLLDLPFSVLCFDHGAPLTDDPKAALRRLLDSSE
jgi:glyoxylase-like metal-dependent hydrolase (beta-lactamase superfamily II)